MSDLINVLHLLQAWHWLALGVVLLMLDTLFVGGFLLGLTLAAVSCWLLVLTVPDLSWEWQLLTFSILSIAYSILYKRYFKSFNEQTDVPYINNRAAQMVGKELHLSAAVEKGQNKLQIGDTFWDVMSELDLERGSKVRIARFEGMVLYIEVLDEA